MSQGVRTNRLGFRMIFADQEVRELIKKSLEVRECSYSPYSNFKVGAALRCDDGSISSGCNVENASYPVGICAERTALTKAVSDGKRKFLALSVIADKVDGKFTTPCGMCRQMTAEFGNIPVYISSPTMDQVLVTSSEELLPLGYVLVKNGTNAS